MVSSGYGAYEAWIVTVTHHHGVSIMESVFSKRRNAAFASGSGWPGTAGQLHFVMT
jgi:hypothetical protein